MALDKRGRELPDPRPVEWPVGVSRPLSIQEEIQRFVRVEMSRRAQEHGMESFEEADDFDVEEEDDWQSPYQLTELQEETIGAPPAPRSPSGSEGEPPTPPAEQDLSGKDDVQPIGRKGTVADKRGAQESAQRESTT